MRGANFLPVLAALCGGISLVPVAWAGGADPLVIQGIGPDNDMVRAQPAPLRTAAGGGLGGGFLELLVTGRDPTARVETQAPSRQVPAQMAMPAAMPMPAAPRAEPRIAPVQRAYVEPAATEPTMGVRREIEPRFHRQEVDYADGGAPGSIVVDTPSRFLYLVLGNGRALRYGIGVGRPGFEWAGVKTVSRKAEWPDWTPPPEMLKRRPELPRHMAGGPENPLGARALYLGSSMYRIHGTNEPWTIGHNVSSGCIRMMNEDVIDLFERVKVGTKVRVI